MSNPIPTTQAVEQLREKIAEKMVEVDEAAHWDECQEEYCDYYSSPKDFYDKANQIISALADTLKIVGEEIIGNEVTVNPHLGTVNPQEAQNRLRVAQRQRLELVVGEMRAR